ncbi:MAG TPA: helix-hairpin-helix domain-containing protein [Tepidisphaeraceae bacterium]
MAGRGERLSHALSLDASQRRVLAVLLGVLIVYAGVRLTLNPVYIADPQPVAGDRASELADKLDPNTATVGDLSVLPGIGEKRAQAIVTWRERVQTRDGTAAPFQTPDDLLKVAGFGQSTVAQLTPYLVFPVTQNMADINQTTP